MPVVLIDIWHFCFISLPAETMSHFILFILHFLHLLLIFIHVTWIKKWQLLFLYGLPAGKEVLCVDFQVWVRVRQFQVLPMVCDFGGGGGGGICLCPIFNMNYFWKVAGVLYSLSSTLIRQFHPPSHRNENFSQITLTWLHIWVGLQIYFSHKFYLMKIAYTKYPP